MTASGRSAAASGLTNGGHDERGIANAGKINEQDPVRVFVNERLGHGDGQPGLADPSGTGQRHEPMLPQELDRPVSAHAAAR